jgi:methylated-DNA-[protein]-cysteine S-methyltransferase
MADMRSLERALEREGKRTYAAESERAAERLTERAALDGLLDVAYMRTESPVGPIMLAATQRGLVRISFGRSLDVESFVDRLAASVSPRVFEAPSYFDAVRRELDEYFEGRRTKFDLPLDWSLTGGFRRRVLKRTARIPYGETSTYRQVAADAGNPLAVRAAGNALGANPIPLVVPCHRVLRTGGGLGGYGGGVEVKEFLLRLEGVAL